MTNSKEYAFRTAFLKELWLRLGRDFKSVVIYGGGKHTHYFISEIASKYLAGPELKFIIDDNPATSEIFSIPVIRPPDKLEDIDLILISSDVCEKVLHEKAVAKYSSQVKAIICPYSKIGDGPFELPKDYNQPLLVDNYVSRDYLEDYIKNPHVLVEITSRCNFVCPYCKHPKMTRPKQDMSWEFFQKIAKQLPELTNRQIILDISGEPTLHPHFIDMALLVNSYGLPVRLFSNGSRLKKEYFQISGDHVISANVNAEGFNERCPGKDFREYTEGIINYTKEWMNADPCSDLVISFLYSDPGHWKEYDKYSWAKHIEFAEDFIKRAGIPEEKSRRNKKSTYYFYFKNKNGKRLAIIFSPILYYGPYSAPLRETSRFSTDEGFCDFPWKLFCVRSDGLLGHCCKALENCCSFTEQTFDNEYRSLRDIWFNDPKLQEVRKSFLEGKIPQDTVCRKCLTHSSNAVSLHSLGFDPFAAHEEALKYQQ